MDLTKKKNKNYVLVVFAIVIIALYLLSNTVLGMGIRNGISYVYFPLYFYSMEIGSRTNKYIKFFPQINRIIEEYEEGKLELAKLESMEADYYLLFDENEKLKNQLLVRKIQEESVETSFIPCQTMYCEFGYINKGQRDGIQNESVVTMGNTVVGIIESVSTDSSVVTLLNDKDVSMKVAVVSGTLDNTSLDEIKKIVKNKNVLGVLIGKGDSIVVENIPVGKNVNEGDYVVVYDERFRENYVIGEIESIVSDPANPTLTAKLRTTYDIADLTYVFVYKK